MMPKLFLTIFEILTEINKTVKVKLIKHFTLVIYNSRFVLNRKLPILQL